MSFSSKAKEEICRTPSTDKKSTIVELFAIISSAGNISLSNKGMALKIHFENLPIAKRSFQNLTRFMGIDCEIDVIDNKMKKKNTYSLVIKGRETVMNLLQSLGFPKENTLFLSHIPPSSLLSSGKVKSAFLRGLFLGCGTISNPKKNYHLEFVFGAKDFAYYVLNILHSYKLFAKIVFRKSNYVVYLQGGDNIAKLLAIIGANSSILELENIRILKEMRNNVNRAVNCETANINKTVDASMKQLKIIKLIESEIGLDNLSEPLAEAAKLRLNNPEASLSELAELSSMGSTKSGINHRFRKLTKIAEDLLSKEDLL